MTKDDNSKFSKAVNGEITAKDTDHLYFTANCKTDVQGGYRARFCSATRKAGTLKLNFADGLPAYANKFDVFIKGAKFHFKPTIIYPIFSPGEKTIYKVTRSGLTLYQKDYLTSKIISGYINTEFTESVTSRKGKAETHKYYFRGHFKTRVKT